MIVLGIDAETNGLAVSSDLVEIGWCVFDLDDSDVCAGGYEVFRVRGMWSPGAESVHKITRNMSEKSEWFPEDFDLWERVQRYQPQAVIAHNAEFDHKFCRRHWPQLCEIPWICTMNDLNHRAVIPAYKSGWPKKLNHLCLEYGISFDPASLHRSLVDAELGCRLAAKHYRNQDGTVREDEHGLFYKIAERQATEYMSVAIGGQFIRGLDTQPFHDLGFKFERDDDKRWHLHGKVDDIIALLQNGTIAEICPGGWDIEEVPTCGPRCGRRLVE